MTETLPEVSKSDKSIERKIRKLFLYGKLHKGPRKRKQKKRKKQLITNTTSITNPYKYSQNVPVIYEEATFNDPTFLNPLLTSKTVPQFFGDYQYQRPNLPQSNSFNYFDNQYPQNYKKSAHLSPKKPMKRSYSVPQKDIKASDLINESEMELLVQNLVGLIPKSAVTSISDTNYDIACPYSIIGCEETLKKLDFEEHMAICRFRAKETKRDFSHLEEYNPLNHIVACPYRIIGCEVSCKRSDLPDHLENCSFRVNDVVEKAIENEEYELVCPNAIMGCEFVCLRSNVEKHLNHCEFNPVSREVELMERQENKKLAIEAAEKERKRRVKVHKYRFLTKTDTKDDKTVFTEALNAIAATRNLHLKKKGRDRVTWIVRAAEIEILRHRILKNVEKRRELNSKYAVNDRRFNRTASISSTKSLPDNITQKEVLPQRLPTDDFQLQATNSTAVRINIQQDIKNLLTFCKTEAKKVKDKINDIQQDIRETCENCFSDFNVSLEVYGSYATELALPTISDVDFVLSIHTPLSSKGKYAEYESILIQNQSHIINSFRCEILGRHLKSLSTISQLKAIFTASVPIIKFQYQSKVSVDISFNTPQHKGLKNVEFINSMKNYYKELYSLTCLLKIVLYKHNLADPFSGGLSSYSLVLMIFASIGRSKEKGKDERNVLELFLDFLRTFGFEFNAKQDMINFSWLEKSIDLPCIVYITKRKREISFVEDCVLIKDPFDESNNVSRSTFRFKAVQNVLQNVYRNIISVNADIQVNTLSSSNCCLESIFSKELIPLLNLL